MTAADMRRQRWQKEVVRWRTADSFVVALAVFGMLCTAVCGGVMLEDRRARTQELEAQLQRLQEPVRIVLPGQSMACGPRGIIPALGGYMLSSHATSQQGPVVYSCGGKNP